MSTLRDRFLLFYESTLPPTDHRMLSHDSIYEPFIIFRFEETLERRCVITLKLKHEFFTVITQFKINSLINVGRLKAIASLRVVL